MTTSTQTNLEEELDKALLAGEPIAVAISRLHNAVLNAGVALAIERIRVGDESLNIKLSEARQTASEAAAFAYSEILKAGNDLH